MIRFKILSFLLLHQVSSLPTSTEDKCRDEGRGDQLFLWSVQQTDTSPPSWLMGTVHVPHNLLDIPWQAQKAFDDAEELYTEISNDNYVDCAAAKKGNASNNAAERPPEEVFDVTEEEIREALQSQLNYILSQVPSWFPDKIQQQSVKGLIYSWARVFKKKKMEAAGWARVIGELSNKSFLTVVTGYPILDKHLDDVAKKQGKIVGAVETTVSHCNSIIYANLSPVNQYGMLVNQLQYLEQNRNKSDSLDHVINAYNCLKIGSPITDVPDVKEVSDDDLEFINWHNNDILVNRNREMAKKIKVLTESSEKSRMFAFGTAHFLGPASVVDFLVRDKMIVRRINVTDDLEWTESTKQSDNNTWERTYLIIVLFLAICWIRLIRRCVSRALRLILNMI